MRGGTLLGVTASESLHPCRGWLHALVLGYAGHVVLPTLCWKQVPGAKGWQPKWMLHTLEGDCIPT